MTTINDLATSAERAEAEFMFQYVSSTPSAVAARLGIATTRIGGGVALSMRYDPSGYWSKAVGFDGPVTEDVIEEVLAFYLAEHSPGATIQVAPPALPDDWAGIHTRYGLKPTGRIVKLACPIEDHRISDHGPPAPATRTRLRVAPVTADDADEWAAVVLRGLGMPTEGLSAMFVATVGHPAFRPFAVWDGEHIVAGANLFIHDGVGSLNAAGTLPSHRDQGAQSALIAARAEQAKAEGCRMLVAEAGHPDPGQSNPSLNNMRRAGLRDLYIRRNWRWTPES